MATSCVDDVRPTDGRDVETDVPDLWQQMSRRQGAPVTETDLPMGWDELDHDLLATLPPRRRCAYLWDGRVASAFDVVTEIDEKAARQF